MSGNGDRLPKWARDLPLRTRPRLVDDQDRWLDEWIVEGHPLAEMEAWIRMAAERRIARRERRRPPHSDRLRDCLIAMLRRKGFSAEAIGREVGITPRRVNQISRKLGPQS